MHIIILGVTKYIIQDIIPRKNEGKTTYHSRRIFIECIPKLQNTGKINQIIKVLHQHLKITNKVPKNLNLQLNM